MIGRTLAYAVTQPPFVFNLEAAQFPRQFVRSERLVTTPALPEPDRYTVLGTGARLAHFIAPPGRFDAASVTDQAPSATKLSPCRRTPKCSQKRSLEAA